MFASAGQQPRHGTVTAAPLVLLLLMRYACPRGGRQRNVSYIAATETHALRCRRGLWSSHDAGGAEARRGAHRRYWRKCRRADQFQTSHLPFTCPFQCTVLQPSKLDYRAAANQATMSNLYNGPPRGGTRGGKDQFNWDNIKNDKDK